MIPLGDETRHSLRFPLITVFLIVLNAYAFWLELSRGDAFITQWAVIPAHVADGRDLVTVLTAMFLHAGWLHILGNMLFLWVFAPAIEDLMGPLNFLIFYLLGGIAATFAQVYVDPTSQIPNLGASGAVAAVMGAFLLNYPGDRIRTLLIIGWFIDVEFIPAIVLIGLWFFLQLFNAFGSLTETQAGGVAYVAHVGGFVFGALTNSIFKIRHRRRW
jgi:membrane associated rhomboid family serine protease